ncbi:MAG: family 65 glycosyl hydrolase domain-containing protein, partial [Vallitaleaceae bacterium]|nr:family 65 glycosyl hydrolase domain-containing protein [Vallitaleaceae bacterium]
MKEYFKCDEWLVIEEGFASEYNRVSESVMSLGNGHMGMRGNFEEHFSGDSLQGTYYAGVYYPDKTKVGWWKNGYPEFFAKVLNGTNIFGIDVMIDGLMLDFNQCEIKEFKRVLNMKEGYLERTATIIDQKGHESRIVSKRFVSMKTSEIGCVAYSITPLNYDGDIILTPYLDGYVQNEDSNYDEIFWDEVDKKATTDLCHLTTKTNKLDFVVTCAMDYSLELDGLPIKGNPLAIEKTYYVGNEHHVKMHKGQTVQLIKYIAAVTNRDYDNDDLVSSAVELVKEAKETGFDELLLAHLKVWAEKWLENDVRIYGDVKAQQGVRFNIFQLNQTYTGEDARLNIGPKGCTGEKYGGSTYWDTEAYCIPFYLSTAGSDIAKNLLMYRYHHLKKAKENAQKLGLDGALYPMVTMNGEECHNEWEITFEEIHRNGAIAYAIYNYTNYTGDSSYLDQYGIEVLIEISRFWASRVNYNTYKDQYMILGVTGPNEYENNVNNNWYTNTIAAWTITYTLEQLKRLEQMGSESLPVVTDKEKIKWQKIIDKMYYPHIDTYDVFAQQDGYLDKEQILVSELDDKEKPINQNWSWDRILRSCFIKQADVLQGLYFFSDRYDLDTKKRNFDFYEPRTLHESSLSPCVHAIIASEIGYHDKA